VITASILPNVSGLDKTFDYLVPEHLQGQVRIGSLVRVQLAGRRVGGWVLRLGPPSDEVAVERLQPLVTWVGHGPDAETIELARWAATRWGSDRLRPLLVSAGPDRRVKAIGAAVRRRPRSTTHAPRTGASEGVTRLLADGGGVIRVSPTDDVLAVLLAVADAGPTIVVHSSAHERALLASRLRRSGLTVAVLPDDWAFAAAGVDVVIGGRAAVWAPCSDLAAIVVLDEHDEALHEERSPTWNARDIAIERARRHGVPCVLVSPCPTVTALAWSGTRWMRPTHADERAGWPSVVLIDRTDEEPWKRSLITSPLVAALRDVSLRVVCVHNTPGRGRLLACRSCRSLISCERCEVSVQQLDNGMLECRRCGTSRPPACQRCGSAALATVRPGVSRLREELEAAAGRPVAAVTGATSPDDPVLHTSGTQVFVGTEAVLHRVVEADVVAFVDIDAELLAPRYRAAEQAFALLVRAARLVGARSGGGRILVQTFLPGHEVLQAATLADPGRLAKAEAARRRTLLLPPFGALARVSGEGAADLVASTGLASASDGDSFLVRAATWDELGLALADASRRDGGGRAPSARVRIEVDPPR
jgi:primosomal protein N' (replication factor Y)